MLEHHRPELTTMQLRQQLGEILERVHYRFEQFRIVRKDKPMARLVNEDYMQTIDRLIQEDTGLADTIALMMNEDAQQVVQHSRKEMRAGDKISLEQAFGQTNREV